MTRTFVTLEVSARAYNEIKGKLLDAGYQHAIDDDRAPESELIDMHGIALVCVPDPYPETPFAAALRKKYGS